MDAHAISLMIHNKQILGGLCQIIHNYALVEFCSNGSWDAHAALLMIRGKPILGGLCQIIHNYALDLRTSKHICMSVQHVRPSWNMHMKLREQTNTTPEV